MDLEVEAKKRRTLHLDPVVRCEVLWRPLPAPRCTCYAHEPVDPKCPAHGKDPR